MRHIMPPLLGILAMLMTSASGAGEPMPQAPAIVLPRDATALQARAARELLRYVYLRTGQCATAGGELPPSGDAIIIETAPDRLDEQEFELTTAISGSARRVTVAGGSDVATLYAAYRFAESLGVRFHLHGDVIPDRMLEDRRLPIVEERAAPLFVLRGIQPFHDFTEGPDWWNADDYKAHLSQLAKLRMNFLGLHCYPEGGVGPEPLIWIGLPEDVDDDGHVTFSYPGRWASTMGGAWGYASTPTSDFAAGAWRIFDRDDFGPDVTEGHRPLPTSPQACNDLFNRAGDMLADVFEHGHALGIEFCIGTETPLTIPAAVRERLEAHGLDPRDPDIIRRLYEGIFTRIARACPVDHYWLWTPEGWTWSGTTPAQVEATIGDVQLALEALNNVGRPFEFATCGWVLGPPADRVLFDKVLPKDVALSCINRDVGFDPVESGFALISDRPQWAIPWLEDDPAMIIPQLWAGRMRRDAADALAFGCTGLLGIHWRTKVLSPNIAALAQAAWRQAGWNPEFGKRVDPPRIVTSDAHVGGSTADYAGNEITGTDDDRIYQTCRWNVDAYRLHVPDGIYDVTLRFCEVHYREPGRRIFGITIQGKRLMHGLDVFERVGANTPLDLTFKDIDVEDAELIIEFMREIEYPFIAGIVVDGMTAGSNQIDGRPYSRRINCGGGAHQDYEADLPAAGTILRDDHRDRDLPVADFYADWCASEFGGEAADALADLFTRLDGSPAGASGRAANLPRPADWDRGPGGIPPNRTPWERERARYAFVDEMEALRPRIVGAGNLERFDYWLNTFRFLRAVGRAGCLRGELDGIIERITNEPDEAAKRALARNEALPVRIALARQWERMITLQLSVVSTPGGMGTIANLEQHVRRNNAFLSLHDELLAGLLDGGLPPEAEPSRRYAGPPRIIVPTVRGDIGEGESLRLTVIVLDDEAPRRAQLHWRPLGRGAFRAIEPAHRARAVYEVTLPPAEGACLEYYITAVTGAGEAVIWPPTAPAINQTIIVLPRD
jgi:hypothetical protein